MYINQLQATADVADLTSENYFALDGIGGSKKVPADMVKLQQVNPAVDTQAAIYDKINGHAGGVVVAIPSVGSSVEVEMYQLVHAKTEGGVFTARFETTSGGLIKVATCVLNDITASTLGAWTYDTQSTVDGLPGIMTDLQKSSDPHAGTLLQKVGNEIKELDGKTLAKANLVSDNSQVNEIIKEMYIVPQVVGAERIYIAKAIANSSGKYTNAVRLENASASAVFFFLYKSDYATQEEALADLNDVIIKDDGSAVYIDWSDINDGTSKYFTHVAFNAWNDLNNCDYISNFLANSEVPKIKDELTSDTERIANVEEKITSAVVDEISSSFTSYNATLGANGWYFYGGNGKHSPIKLFEGDKVRLTNTHLTNNAAFARVTSAYVPGNQANGAAVPFSSAQGSARTIVAPGGVIEFVAQKEDAYAIISIQSGGGDENTWRVEVSHYGIENISSIARSVEGSKNEGVSSSLVSYNASLAANTWYFYNGNGTHCELKLTEDDLVTITPNALSSFCRVNSNFVPGNQVNHGAIPFSSAQNERVVLQPNETYSFVAQPDDAFLILTTKDGGGNVNVWNYSIVSQGLKDLQKLASSLHFAKLKFATWNVGHFAMGASGDTTITPEEKEAKKVQYRTLLNSVGADVICVEEDSVNFCTDGTKSANVIWNLYKNIVAGTKNGYNMNSIYSNGLQVLSSSEHFFSTHTAQHNRYWKEVKCALDGVEVYIVSSHYDWGAKTIQLAQYNEIIEYYKDKPRVVICGDFNASTEYDVGMNSVVAPMFKDAGYKAALCDYIGEIPTIPESNEVLDNVFTKGFSIGKVEVVSDSELLSDHKMVTCELTMN